MTSESPAKRLKADDQKRLLFVEPNGTKHSLDFSSENTLAVSDLNDRRNMVFMLCFNSWDNDVFLVSRFICLEINYRLILHLSLVA